MSDYRIEVDLGLCQGHGVCESEAPEVFEVGRDRQVHILDPQPGESHRQEVQAAVKYCPTHALRIEGIPGEPPAAEAGGTAGTIDASTENQGADR
ncbi:MAG: ferredoxin [Microthrixaceae bacterium]